MLPSYLVQSLVLVSFAAVVWSRHTKCSRHATRSLVPSTGESALHDDTNNGCKGDFFHPWNNWIQRNKIRSCDPRIGISWKTKIRTWKQKIAGNAGNSAPFCKKYWLHSNDLRRNIQFYSTSHLPRRTTQPLFFLYEKEFHEFMLQGFQH